MGRAGKTLAGRVDFSKYNSVSYLLAPAVTDSEKIANFSVEGLVAEAQQKEAAGVQELSLIAPNGGVWPDHAGNILLELLEALLTDTNIGRIRIGAIEATAFSEQLFEMIKHPRICGHIHLPLRSGSDAILQKMQQPYDTGYYRAVVECLYRARSDMAITTEVIVGFPSETKVLFQETQYFCREMEFVEINVIPYSSSVTGRSQRGLRSEQVSQIEKNRRVNALIELSSQLQRAFYSDFIGGVFEVLLEREISPGIFLGYTGNYIQVHVATGLKRATAKSIVLVRLESISSPKTAGVMLGRMV